MAGVLCFDVRGSVEARLKEASRGGPVDPVVVDAASDAVMAAMAEAFPGVVAGVLGAGGQPGAAGSAVRQPAVREGLRLANFGLGPALRGADPGERGEEGAVATVLGLTGAGTADSRTDVLEVPGEDGVRSETGGRAGTQAGFVSGPLRSGGEPVIELRTGPGQEQHRGKAAPAGGAAGGELMAGDDETAAGDGQAVAGDNGTPAGDDKALAGDEGFLTAGNGDKAGEPEPGSAGTGNTGGPEQDRAPVDTGLPDAGAWGKWLQAHAAALGESAGPSRAVDGYVHGENLAEPGEGGVAALAAPVLPDGAGRRLEDLVDGVAGLPGRAGGGLPAADCVVLLEGLARALYPRAGEGFLPGGVRASGTADDLALGAGGAGLRLAPGATWRRVPSWGALAGAVALAGPGATGLVLWQRRSGPGHAFAVHNDAAGGVRWIELQEAPGRRVSGDIPGYAASHARAVIVDGTGRVVRDALPPVPESGVPALALTDPSASRDYAGIGPEFEFPRVVISLAISAGLIPEDQLPRPKDTLFHNRYLKGTVEQLRANGHMFLEIVANPIAEVAGDDGFADRDGFFDSLERLLDYFLKYELVPVLSLTGLGFTVDVKKAEYVNLIPANHFQGKIGMQFTMGVPLAGKYELYRRHLKNELGGSRAKYPEVETALSFADEVAFRFAITVGSDLNADIPLVAGDLFRPEDVYALMGFAASVFSHAMAALRVQHARKNSGVGGYRPSIGTKQYLTVASRHPAPVVRRALPERVRGFLDAYAGELTELFAEYAQRFGPAIEDPFSVPIADPDADLDVTADPGATVGGYLDDAFLGDAEKPRVLPQDFNIVTAFTELDRGMGVEREDPLTIDEARRMGAARDYEELHDRYLQVTAVYRDLFARARHRKQRAESLRRLSGREGILLRLAQLPLVRDVEDLFRGVTYLNFLPRDPGTGLRVDLNRDPFIDMVAAVALHPGAAAPVRGAEYLAAELAPELERVLQQLEALGAVILARRAGGPAAAAFSAALVPWAVTMRDALRLRAAADPAAGNAIPEENFLTGWSQASRSSGPFRWRTAELRRVDASVAELRADRENRERLAQVLTDIQSWRLSKTSPDANEHSGAVSGLEARVIYELAALRERPEQDGTAADSPVPDSQQFLSSLTGQVNTRLASAELAVTPAGAAAAKAASAREVTAIYSSLAPADRSRARIGELAYEIALQVRASPPGGQGALRLRGGALGLDRILGLAAFSGVHVKSRQRAVLAEARRTGWAGRTVPGARLTLGAAFAAVPDGGQAAAAAAQLPQSAPGGPARAPGSGLELLPPAGSGHAPAQARDDDGVTQAPSRAEAGREYGNAVVARSGEEAGDLPQANFGPFTGKTVAPVAARPAEEPARPGTGSAAVPGSASAGAAQGTERAGGATAAASREQGEPADSELGDDDSVALVRAIAMLRLLPPGLHELPEAGTSRPGGGGEREAVREPASASTTQSPRPRRPTPVVVRFAGNRLFEGDLEPVQEPLWRLAAWFVDSGVARREVGRRVLGTEIAGFNAGPRSILSPGARLRANAEKAGLGQARDLQAHFRKMIISIIRGRTTAWLAAAGLGTEDRITAYANELVPPGAVRGEYSKDRHRQVSISVPEETGSALPRIDLRAPLEVALADVESLRRDGPARFRLAWLAHLMTTSPEYAAITVHGAPGRSGMEQAEVLRRQLVDLVAEEIGKLPPNAPGYLTVLADPGQMVFPVTTSPDGVAGTCSRAVVTLHRREEAIAEEYPWLPQINPLHSTGGDYETNCVLATTAVHAKLAGGEIRPVGPARKLKYDPGRPMYTLTFVQALGTMLASPPGARATMLLYGDTTEENHVFNVVRNARLGVVLLDGQTGTELDRARWPRGETDIRFWPFTDDIVVTRKPTAGRRVAGHASSVGSRRGDGTDIAGEESASASLPAGAGGPSADDEHGSGITPAAEAAGRTAGDTDGTSPAEETGDLVGAFWEPDRLSRARRGRQLATAKPARAAQGRRAVGLTSSAQPRKAAVSVPGEGRPGTSAGSFSLGLSDAEGVNAEFGELRLGAALDPDELGRRIASAFREHFKVPSGGLPEDFDVRIDVRAGTEPKIVAVVTQAGAKAADLLGHYVRVKLAHWGYPIKLCPR